MPITVLPLQALYPVSHAVGSGAIEEEWTVTWVSQGKGQAVIVRGWGKERATELQQQDWLGSWRQLAAARHRVRRSTHRPSKIPSCRRDQDEEGIPRGSGGCWEKVQFRAGVRISRQYRGTMEGGATPDTMSTLREGQTDLVELIRESGAVPKR